MAGSALDLFTKPELIEKAKKEQKERIKGQTYICPIPDDIMPPMKHAEEAWEKLKGKDYPY